MTGESVKLTLKSDAIPTKFYFGEPKMKSQQKGRRSDQTAKLQPRLSPRKFNPKMLRRVGGAYAKTEKARGEKYSYFIARVIKIVIQLLPSCEATCCQKDKL